jgi:hypothetical protein
MEDQGLKRKSITAWPKVLGLEQILQDMDLRRKEALVKATNTTHNYSGKCTYLSDFYFKLI